MTLVTVQLRSIMYCQAGDDVIANQKMFPYLPPYRLQSRLDARWLCGKQCWGSRTYQ